MFNFVALAEENHKWLNESTIQLVNESLAMKREEFSTHVASGRYWNMTEQEKMIVSPEIRRIEWFPIDQAIAMMESSLLDPYTPIDEWQRRQFHEYGVERRDPMFVTMKILQHIAAFESPEALLAHTKQLTAPLLESLHQSSNL
ncbi:hypothetical protein Poli38472_012919 [Pythium oligandrum]|uniref:Uncharacterized protein n=1 Tax=Pythium oligandrum TaxID=41045 RepID=A0A8K1CIY4_PYTOL|nr:hypothetical protein Poli38472_012919 [Pythium oligandrum]|eukprot:TMW64297.1 hypothetical protein Poli38472_012919 [Pythium oligandrum]